MDLSELNVAQRAAVTAPDGAHLVIAGAGTGKTRTLVHRVAWLIERGVSPRGIVLLTFTRRAAAEMLDRVARLVGPRAREVRGGTFHAFAHGALRRHAAVLGYPPTFTLLDRGDAADLVGLVRAELALGGGGRRFPQKGTLLSMVSKSVNTGASLEDVVADGWPQYVDAIDDIGRVAVRYAERKQQQGVVDFDDLLVLLARLLREHPDARRALSSAAQHVLVDEYQDTNRLQAFIAGLLASVHGNLMVVGDEAQSIYGFRGAVVDNILQFPAHHPGCATTVLEENYRSVQPVLDLANAILEHAERGYRKHLVAASGDDRGDLPVLADVVDEHEQADLVVRRVLELREQGVPLEQQAVLYRAGHHATLIEAALAEANVPYRKYGGVKFHEAAHIKDVFALLRLVANPRDEIAWVRVLCWGPGLGPRTAERLAGDARRAADGRLPVDAHRGRKYHAHLVEIDALLTRVRGLDLVPLVDAVIEAYRARIADLYEDAKQRVRDLDALPLLAERYGTLEAFLAELALDPLEEAEATDPDPDDELLTLSTVHSAKGLEWDAVTVVQLGDGAFPSAWALDTPEEAEEERRLFYVAVTRARRHLMLVRPRFLRVRRGPVQAGACALLDELDALDDLVDVVRGAPPARGGGGVRAAPDVDELERVARLLEAFGRSDR